MKQLKLCLAVLMLSSFAATLYAESAPAFWPAWRGPESTGLAPGANPPTTWSETQNVKWKFKLTGDASSGSPIVWKDKIVFQSAVKTDKLGSTGVQDKDNKLPTNIHKFNLVCLDRNTGNLLWEKTVREALPLQGHHADHGFASFSPITDGKYVWANFGSQGLYCYDFDGKLIWSKDLVNMKTMFGAAGSLALAGDTVVVVADSETESFIFAFNKTTGDLLWKKPRDEKGSYATPVVAAVNGQLQIIAGASKVRSYDAKTGDIVWEGDKTIQNGIPTPVTGFDMVFCASGSRGSGALTAVKLGKTGIVDANDIAWKTKEVAPHIASPLLYGRRLYVPSAGPARLSCFDAKTGKVFFDKQPLDKIKDAYASPVGAADKIYFVGRDGTTCVIRNADTFELLATNKLDDVIDGTPAIVNDEIFLKGKQYVYCIAEKK
jgi:outer membrane protein assembly factor BamB